MPKRFKFRKTSKEFRGSVVVTNDYKFKLVHTKIRATAKKREC